MWTKLNLKYRNDLLEWGLMQHVESSRHFNPAANVFFEIKRKDVTHRDAPVYKDGIPTDTVHAFKVSKMSRLRA